ncbi:hypothetical protein OIU76_002742 [Salix suchowensis]|nr:hypothetical protein OIU76_002742 [Salix suchowensis]
MEAKGVLREVLDWARSRLFFFHSFNSINFPSNQADQKKRKRKNLLRILVPDLPKNSITPLINTTKCIFQQKTHLTTSTHATDLQIKAFLKQQE